MIFYAIITMAIGVCDIIDQLPQSTIIFIYDVIMACVTVHDIKYNYLLKNVSNMNSLDYGNYIHKSIVNNKYNPVRLTLNKYTDLTLSDKYIFEHDVYKSYRNIQIHGVIDFITNGVIVDFKTGNVYHKHILQVALYWWMTNSIYNQRRLSLIYIDMGYERIITINNKTKFQHAVSMILSTYSKIVTK